MTPTNDEIDAVLAEWNDMARCDRDTPHKMATMLRALRDQREAEMVTPNDLSVSLCKWATESTQKREMLAYVDGWTNCRNAHIARAALSAQGEK
jgi:hypothetical protein